jgi:hypothetical protein
MGLASAWSLVMVIGLAAPAGESSGPDVTGAVDDLGDRVQLRVPELSFGRPSTLYILGKGRFGTWSLVGSTLGGMLGCADVPSVRCLDLATAQGGIAWRPFGSLVSLFAAIGVTTVPGAQAPPGFMTMGGVQVDLPSRTRWSRSRGR